MTVKQQQQHKIRIIKSLNLAVEGAGRGVGVEGWKLGRGRKGAGREGRGRGRCVCEESLLHVSN